MANNFAGVSDPSQGILHPANRNLVSQEFQFFLCPSSAGDREPFVVKDIGGNPLAAGIELGRSHYVANAGHEEPWGMFPASSVLGVLSRMDRFTEILPLVRGT